MGIADRIGWFFLILSRSSYFLWCCPFTPSKKKHTKQN